MGKQSSKPQNYTGAPAQGGGFFGGLGRAVNTGIDMNRNAISGGIDVLTGAPATPDYMGAAGTQGALNQQATQQQTQANRPGQNTPFGFTQWTQDAHGNWTQNTGLNGGLGDAAKGLQGQASGLGNAMDWGQFGKIDDGSAARDQAINASYAQATSRLNPQWAQNAQLQSSSLANAGLDPNSAAARSSNLQFQQGRNDAYGSAMNNAIHDGTAAQTATFNQNMMARQQAIAEALRKRGQPLEELNALQGFTTMPGFMGAGQASPTPYLQAMGMQNDADYRKWQQQQQMMGDMMQGAGQLGQAGAGAAPGLAAAAPALFALSDERAKTNITRLDVEALPGVPFATWDYLPEHGGARGFGVVAQDLQKVRPEFVSTRDDGLLVVDYSFLGVK